MDLWPRPSDFMFNYINGASFYWRIITYIIYKYTIVLQLYLCRMWFKGKAQRDILNELRVTESDKSDLVTTAHYLSPCIRTRPLEQPQPPIGLLV